MLMPCANHMLQVKKRVKLARSIHIYMQYSRLRTFLCSVRYRCKIIIKVLDKVRVSLDGPFLLELKAELCPKGEALLVFLLPLLLPYLASDFDRHPLPLPVDLAAAKSAGSSSPLFISPLLCAAGS